MERGIKCSLFREGTFNKGSDFDPSDVHCSFYKFTCQQTYAVIYFSDLFVLGHTVCRVNSAVICENLLQN